MVTDWTMQHGQKEVVKLCGTAQVPCGIVAAIDEIFEDPHYAARENIVRVRSARAGEIAVPNVVPRLTGTPGSVEWLGPAPGGHNAALFGGLPRPGAAEMTRLADAEVP